jgi:LPS-assembly lipoprotein
MSAEHQARSIRPVGLRPSESRPGQRLPRRALLALVASGVLLGGCGFRPLYERPTAQINSGGVSARLAQIRIDPVTGQKTPDPLTGSSQALYDARTAQLLQNQLRQDLNPYGSPSDPAYHLAVQLDQFSRGTVTQSNQQVNRYELELLAKYQLLDLKGRPLLSDSSRAVTAYDLLQEPFSDLQAKQDAVQRAVQELSIQIQTRLSVFLEK